MKKCSQWIAPVAASAALLSGTTLLAQDWPQWRGPNRDGKVTGFTAPAAWPTNLTQKWQIKVGKGDSSPVLVGEKLYVFARQEAEEVVLCLEAGSGKTVWEARYPAGRVVTGPAVRHPGPRSTPVVAAGKVCTLGIGGILSCFEAAKGTLSAITAELVARMLGMTASLKRERKACCWRPRWTRPACR